jgi:Chaperone of endosialidase
MASPTTGPFSGGLSTALPILGGIGGTLAGLFPTPSNSQQTNWGQGTQNSSSSGSSSSNSSSSLNSLLQLLQTISGTSTAAQSGTTSTTPNLSPGNQQLIDQLTRSYSTLTNPSLTGYGAQQTSSINANSNAQEQAVNALMASRGLSTSPVAGTAQAGIEQNRVNQIDSMQQQLPILQNQMNLQNLGAASSFAASIPKGSTTTTGGQSTQSNEQTTESSQQQQQQQQQFQNMWQNLFSYLAQQNTGGSQTSSSTGGGTGSAIAGGLSGLLGLASLFSDKSLKKDIKPIDKAIEKVRAIQPKSWKWKGGATQDAGVLAQDLEEILPELVHTDKSTGIELKKVNYAGLIPYLVGAIQDLDTRVEAIG